MEKVPENKKNTTQIKHKARITCYLCDEKFHQNEKTF